MSQDLLPTPVIRYLELLEIQLKSLPGVVPEEAISDAREYLARDYEALLQVEPSLSEEAVFSHFLQTFGPPEEVARDFAAGEPPTAWREGLAPQWRICCTRCGRSAPAAKAGIIRIGAWSFHKYILGFCRGCRRLRWLRLQRDLHRATLVNHLGERSTPDEMRVASHKPGLTIATILVLVSSVLFASLWARSGTMGPLEEGASGGNQSGFENLPHGWSIERQDVVGRRQLSTFSAKLGGKIDYLANTFLSDGSRTAQINTIRAASSEDANRIYKSLLSLKKDSRSLVRNENDIYEFVNRSPAAARLANEAKYRLDLQPATLRYRIRFKAFAISDGNYSRWNVLFNLNLQMVKTPESPTLRMTRRELLEQFEPSKQLMLSRLGLGPFETAWHVRQGETTIEPATTAVTEANVRYDSRSEVDSHRFEVEGTVIAANNHLVELTSVEQQSKRKESLGSTRWWPIDDPLMRQLASQVTDADASAQQKVADILAWMADETNLRYDGVTGSRYGALQVANQRFGHCWDYADLMICLCRAHDVPARQVFGWLYPGEGHVWCQIAIDGQWRHFDPTSGTQCGSDYIPLVISANGAMPLLYDSLVEITPLPRAAR